MLRAAEVQLQSWRFVTGVIVHKVLDHWFNSLPPYVSIYLSILKINKPTPLGNVMIVTLLLLLLYLEKQVCNVVGSG